MKNSMIEFQTEAVLVDEGIILVVVTGVSPTVLPVEAKLEPVMMNWFGVEVSGTMDNAAGGWALVVVIAKKVPTTLQSLSYDATWML